MRTIIQLLLILIFTVPAPAQGLYNPPIRATEKCAYPSDKRGKAIKRYANLVYLQQKKYIHKEIEFMGQSSEGGYIVVYYSGKKLKYIEVALYGAIGQTKIAYYLYAPNKVLVVNTDFTNDLYSISYRLETDIGYYTATRFIIDGDKQWQVNKHYQKIAATEKLQEIKLFKRIMQHINKHNK